MQSKESKKERQKEKGKETRKENDKVKRRRRVRVLTQDVCLCLWKSH